LLSGSCGKKPVAPEAGIIKVAIYADGHITLNGSKATIDSMRESFKNLAAQKGTVYYYREAAPKWTPEQGAAMWQVMEAIATNRLSSRFSSLPDYSDSITNAAVGADGQLINK
jgi:hypothetical protein